MKKIWDFFCSLALSIYLGLGLCVLLWIGSICFLSNGKKLAPLNDNLLIPWLYQQGWSGLLTTWWLWLILLVILLLAINTVVCSIDRLVKLIPRLIAPKLDVKLSWLSGLAIKQEAVINAPFDEVKTYLGRLLQFKGMRKYHCQEQEDGAFVIYAQKGRWMSLAPYLAHLGFLLVLSGHLISSSSGFKSFGNWASVGEKMSLPNSPLWLRVEYVEPCFNEDESRDNFCSEVSLGKGKQTLHNDWLGVNKPIFYDDLNIYQLSWEEEAKNIALTITENGKSKEISLFPGETRKINQDISVLPYMIIPDFTFGPDGQPSSRSGRFNNPAMLLMILENGMPVKQAWLFSRKPEFQRQIYKGIEIKFSGVAIQSLVMINVARNPGAMTVLVGGILFILSSAWLLLGNYRRFWFYLEEQEGAVKLTCAGMSNQRKARMRAKIALVCDSLEKKFSQEA